MNYVPPSDKSRAFTCPHCGVYAQQHRYGYALTQPQNYCYDGVADTGMGGIGIAKCTHCTKTTVWIYESQVYPFGAGAPLPNPDMPEDVQEDYLEAAEILARSPRGAAALLRLAVQKLMKHLGERGDNIDKDIRSLVTKGLPVRIQQALDIVRVTGNNAVHPGQIDTDDPDVAGALFPLVNLIVEDRISLPARVDDMYHGLPDSVRQAIAKKDGRESS
ncbi:DUF4145 domain-containing protein [Pseudomonas sp. NPDC090201]|uniref:DUF4145 domain-containing protein n=1 Tax=Pseudomonas sp. NPDC090201 TaxID=3364475 RepID=UPI003823A24D